MEIIVYKSGQGPVLLKHGSKGSQIVMKTGIAEHRKNCRGKWKMGGGGGVGVGWGLGGLGLGDETIIE